MKSRNSPLSVIKARHNINFLLLYPALNLFFQVSSNHQKILYNMLYTILNHE